MVVSEKKISWKWVLHFSILILIIIVFKLFKLKQKNQFWITFCKFCFVYKVGTGFKNGIKIEFCCLLKNICQLFSSISVNYHFIYAAANILHYISTHPTHFFQLDYSDYRKFIKAITPLYNLQMGINQIAGRKIRLPIRSWKSHAFHHHYHTETFDMILTFLEASQKIKSCRYL